MAPKLVYFALKREPLNLSKMAPRVLTMRNCSKCTIKILSNVNYNKLDDEIYSGNVEINKASFYEHGTLHFVNRNCNIPVTA